MNKFQEITEVLNYLKENRIRVWIEDNYIEYDAPTGTKIDELITILKDNKTEIIKFFSEESGIDKTKMIKPIPKKDSYELSNAQRRLWILDQYEEGSIAYNIPTALILKGELDIESFKHAYSSIIERHESLRTVFTTEEGEPRQKILDNPDFSIKIIDLRGNPDAEKEARSLAEKDLLTSFNLGIGPLVRITVVRIEDGNNLLLFNMHHIISDGWSMNIFIREYLNCYHSFRNGETPILQSLKIHYKDYSAWQNNLLRSEEIKSQKEYWLNKLSGELPVLDLPSDKIRPASQTYNGNSRDFFLSKDLHSALIKLCKENNISLFMMLQALVKVLFYRYTGQSDIILGSPVAGRVHEDLVNQIGFYVNTLALRDTIEGELSFTEILKRVGRTCTEAFENQTYPFDRLVEELDIKGDLSRSPLFDVMLTLQNNEESEIRFDGLDVSFFETEDIISKFDMTFSFSEVEEGLCCDIEYNTDIYAEDRTARIAEHLKTLVSSVLENPESRIRDLGIIGDEERNLLLNVFNETKIDYPADKTIIEMFEEQVEKTPDNIAVVFEDTRLTFKELNKKANIVGQYLIDNYDLKFDDLVAVMLDRSDNMIIALLGILKSGAGYVPVDPEYPQDRINYILDDSKAKLVIAENNYIDINDILLTNTNTENLSIKRSINSNLYVIYTSGTTGKPKGAIINNSNYCNYITWAKDYYLDNQDMGNFPLFTSISFDLTTTSIFLTLLQGRCLEVFNQKTEISDVLGRIFENELIDSIKLTPSHITLLRDLKIKESNIQLVIVGGEELSTDQVEILKEINPDIRIVNEYGPTETTVGCIVKEIEDPKEKILIGKPISNTRIYLLNNNNPVPVNVPGEIYISGTGVGAGYLNKPELTEEKFIDNPFVPGERMYKTGDKARWLTCGNIEFLGRIDNQVKIRGFRIELGEIENYLLQHEDITSVVVLAKDGMDGNKQLVAYIVSGKKLEVSELRVFLKKSLPEYMIPSYLMQMDKLPLTPNGKIDRKALPEPNGSINTGVEYVAPVNETQKTLVEIWQDILGIEIIGIHDNFFELGGHSLKGTRVATRIRKIYQVNILLKEIFENQTIETLSEVINRAKKSEYKQIEVVKKQISYDLSNAQRRLWVLDQVEEDSIAYNMPAAFLLEGELNIGSFKRAFSFMVERHESLRTVFIIENGEPRQQILLKPDFGIEIIDLRGNPLAEKEAQIITERELITPFNLESGPLIRFTLILIDDDKSLLLFNMHHIISDGWSMNIFIREFLGSYHSYKNGNIPDFKPLRINYKDYSAWHNALLKDSDMDIQKRYWLDKLSGDIPVLDLPSDKIRPIIQSFKGNSIGLTLPKEMKSDLSTICNEKKISLFMMFHAILKVLFNKYTGQTDILIGSPIAGRVHEDLENQIGFYTNTLVFRDSISSSQTFNEFLISVKKTCTDAFDNQSYPFDRIVDDLDIARDLSRSPLFDVMLTLHNNGNDVIALDGIDVSPYKTENLISKFDLSFDITETEEGLHIFIEYNIDIFSEDRIKRMSDHLKVLINSVLNNLDSKIRDIDILSEKEKNQLLNEFNDTENKFPKDKTIVQIFEEQVERTPDNIAVVYGNIELTYREVNERANIVAHYLLENYSIEADDYVGIVLDRSEKLLISILGIFKSGGAYIPVDPDYPVDRKLYILEDSELKAVISDKRSSEFINENMSNLFIDIDELLKTDLNRQNPGVKAQPENLAYVIYTSGSTGKPKGAMVEHIGMMNHICSKIDLLNVTSKSRIVQNATQCFDISVWQLLTALLKGGATYIYSNDLIFNPMEMSKEVIKNKITILEVVPTFLSMLIETMDKDIVLKDLEYCLVTGEEVKKDLVVKWFEYFPDKKLVNAYGPTEASDDITHYVMDRAPNNSIIPIGKPIQNMNIYIIDKNNKLCPIGVNGEIVVSGVGVGRGYVNNRERTELSFMKDPFIKDKNVRLYKTGDLARWLPDGNIEFLGRIDNQVKIRGFRIELGEIENSLIQHDDISSAIVIVNERIQDDKQLVAYYVSDKEMESYKIMKYLYGKLPSYMVPGNFIKIPEIPLSLNGKIDYKSLPLPSCELVQSNSTTLPNSILEVEILDIIREVLKVDNISVLANFFEMGGHSVTAIQVINKLTKKKNIVVPIRTLFDNPTIRDFAIAIEMEQNSQSEIIDFRKIDRNREIPTSFEQQQLLLFMKIIPDDYSYNVFSALDLVGNFCIEAFNYALMQIVKRHEILRTVFYEKEGVFYQRILDSIEIPLTILDNNESWSDIVLREGKRNFDFHNGPLFNLTLLKISPNHYKLMIVMHHIISDGWSIGIMIKEISHFYKNHNVESFPKLEFQYADYTDWHKRLLDSDVFDQQLNYWKRKLENYKEVLELPTDFSRKPGGSVNGKNKSFRLDSIPKETIEAICRENGITLYMFLLSTFGVLLQKYTGMINVLVGSPVLGRKNSILENLIGYFVNTIVIKLDGSNNPTFRDFLNRVKIDVLDSLNNQDIPFEKVVETLHPSRNIEHNPLFQVMFALQNITMEGIDFPEVETKILPVNNGTAKFDLMFVVQETEDDYVVDIEFDNNIFNESTIANIFNSYKTIIEEVSFNQDKLLSEIEVIPEGTKDMMLNTWNDTDYNFPIEKTFSQLFRDSVYNNSNRICASDDKCKLTYMQVWDMSQKVASKLISERIDVGSHVTLFLERSTKFLVSMIGVFHSRAAYVPIDPNYPEYRIRQILDKSKSNLIITERALFNTVKNSINNIPVLFIEDILEKDLKEDIVEKRINSGIKSDLAYMIFTSGSTGQPKGAMIEQKGMINHLYAKINDLNLKHDTIIQNASQCFDISVWQYLVCLLSGGNVHIVNQDVSMEPYRLFSTAYEVNATILEIVPSMLRVALETERNLKVSKLRYLVVTGEILSNDICKNWYNNYPLVPLINAYGPTECSDDVTHYTVLSDVDVEPVPLPIGSAINNIKAYILDEFLMPAPIGVKGELYIGGIGVGRGYIDNPRETAQAFVPNPFSRNPGERLYKTGDLCRYLPDSRIQYISRIDHQVKIRGFRIELIEIEIAIRKYEGIDNCTVIPNIINNQKRLICYYISKNELEQNQIKNWLTKLLPNYMIPAIFISLEELPLTPNGKIDRDSLPEPIINFDEFDQVYIAPVTDIEKKVAGIIAEILELPKVGLYNNFFDLGGHSLLVNKLVMNIEKEFDYSLNFRDFFENPTVENVSVCISQYIDEKNTLFELIGSMEESEAQELLDRINEGEDLDEILKNIKLVNNV